MKRKLVFELVILLLLITGCVTLNSKNVEDGKFFTAYYGRYNMSKPMGEQCVLINLSLGDEFVISNVDGKNLMIYNFFGGLRTNSFAILQPGKHSVNWIYDDRRAMYGSSYNTGKGTETYEFEPGQYYFFSGERKETIADGKRVSYADIRIGNLKNFDRIQINGKSSLNSEFMSSSTIINGIDSSIKRGMKTAIAQGKIKNIVYDKNIPKEQQSMIYIPGKYIEIVNFSGKRVRWFSNSIFKDITVFIPSGEQTIKLHFHGRPQKRNIELKIDFKPGHRYVFHPNANLNNYSFINMTE